MSTRNKWAPLVLLADLVLPSIAWGVNLTLVVKSIRALNKKAAKERKRSKKLILLRLYIGFLFFLSTLQLASTIGAKSEQDNPSMAAFANIQFENLNCPGIKSAANVFFALILFLTDGLLLWRTWILYNSCSDALRNAVRALLALAAAGTLGVGFTHLILELRALTGKTLSFIFIGTLSVNVIFSTLISARLFYHRHNAQAVFGPGYGKHYISIATMIMESAAINIVVQIPAVVFPFALHGAQLFGVPIVGEFQALSTLLLMSRVAREDAWKQPSAIVLSHMQFSERFQSPKENTRSLYTTESTESSHYHASDMRVIAEV